MNTEQKLDYLILLLTEWAESEASQREKNGYLLQLADSLSELQTNNNQ